MLAGSVTAVLAGHAGLRGVRRTLKVDAALVQPEWRIPVGTQRRIAIKWYVNGKLYKQVLAPGGVPKEAEKAVTTVLSSPYNIPLYELRWPIQFESKGTGQTNDVIVLIDHWSLWERV
jgi:hypothetical protein